MLFNREAEVRATRGTYPYSDQTEQVPPTGLESDNTPLDELSFEDKAGRLGVIADIMVLDRITGQRITEESVKYARTRYEKLVAAGEIEDTAVTESENDLLALARSLGLEKDIMSANAANSAFLVPNPIRAVFSENFMVDGYVNSVTVSYQKFSPSMIPTVAVVDVNMHAIYQGFARRKTTFTTFLELGQREDEDAWKEARPSGEHGVLFNNLQDAGYLHSSGAMLAGISHDGSTNLDKIEVSLTDSTDEGSVRARFAGGFKFRLLGKLTGTPLGNMLKDMDGTPGWDGLKDGLSAKAKLGLSLRARLRATSAADFGLLYSSLQHYTNRGDFFFGDWLSTSRQQLFVAGVDGQRDTGRLNTGDDTLDQSNAAVNASSPYSFYTKSFPITQLGPNRPFGDLADVSETFSFAADTLTFYMANANHDESWLSIGEYGTDEGERWGTKTDTSVEISNDPSSFYLAKGFYGVSAGAPDGTVCPDSITLEGASGYADVTYYVEYQLRLGVRVALLHGTSDGDGGGASLRLVDSGLMYIYPREESSTFGHGFTHSNPKVQNSSGSSTDISEEYPAEAWADTDTNSRVYPWIKGDTPLSFNSLGEKGMVRLDYPESFSMTIDESGTIDTTTNWDYYHA
jgi:hypothetical protein